MKYLALTLLLLMLVPSARAQHWYSSKAWWTGELTMAGGISADMYTTANLCTGCYEQKSAWLIGKHPSTQAVIGLGLGNFTLQTIAHIITFRKAQNNPTTMKNMVMLAAQPIAVGTIHGYWANHNSNLTGVKPAKTDVFNNVLRH